MRTRLMVLPLLLCATPALAQAPVAEPPVQVPPELTDPAVADKLEHAMDALSKAFLDLRIGEVQAALEGRPATAAERKLTVRDVGRVDDKDFQRRMAEARPQIRQGMKALQQSLPEMMRGLQQAQKSLERAVANMPDPTYPKR